MNKWLENFTCAIEHSFYWAIFIGTHRWAHASRSLKESSDYSAKMLYNQNSIQFCYKHAMVAQKTNETTNSTDEVNGK